MQPYFLEIIRDQTLNLAANQSEVYCPKLKESVYDVRHGESVKPQKQIAAINGKIFFLMTVDGAIT